MKNQYFGDIHDYRKYGLIRILSDKGSIRTGICWMLTPNDTRTDGKFKDYLAKPEKYKKYDSDLYDFLGHCIKAGNRNVCEVGNSNKFSNIIFYDPILEDDAGRREQYFADMLKLFQDVDLIFYDPDNGLEVKSKKYGCKDSSKFLYWNELVESYEAGHSILIYQHFRRVNRDDFVSMNSEEIHAKTGSQNIISFRTSHVVFFLIAQKKHSAYFLKKSQTVTEIWAEEIEVTSHSFS